MFPTDFKSWAGFPLKWAIVSYRHRELSKSCLIAGEEEEERHTLSGHFGSANFLRSDI